MLDLIVDDLRPELPHIAHQVSEWRAQREHRDREAEAEAIVVDGHR